MRSKLDIPSAEGLVFEPLSSAAGVEEGRLCRFSITEGAAPTVQLCVERLEGHPEYAFLFRCTGAVRDRDGWMWVHDSDLERWLEWGVEMGVDPSWPPLRPSPRLRASALAARLAG